MRKRVNLNCPSHYAVIYTVSGEDPSFPIVGEIIHTISPNMVTTTPAKWSMGGHTSVVPHKFSNSEYSYDLKVSEVFSDNFIPISHCCVLMDESQPLPKHQQWLDRGRSLRTLTYFLDVKQLKYQTF